jgi:hypothetical protein
MRAHPALLLLVLLGAQAFIPAGSAAPGAGGAMNSGSPPGLLFPTIVTNLTIAFAIILLFILGLYAYASLARFAPYHTWIYLYLVSLTGVVWAFFLVNNGGSFSDSVFIVTTVVGLNLIVHAFRFDRIVIYPSVRTEDPAVSLFDV